MSTPQKGTEERLLETFNHLLFVSTSEMVKAIVKKTPPGVVHQVYNLRYDENFKTLVNTWHHLLYLCKQHFGISRVTDTRKNNKTWWEGCIHVTCFTVGVVSGHCPALLEDAKESFEGTRLLIELRGITAMVQTMMELPCAEVAKNGAPTSRAVLKCTHPSDERPVPADEQPSAEGEHPVQDDGRQRQDMPPGGTSVIPPVLRGVALFRQLGTKNTGSVLLGGGAKSTCRPLLIHPSGSVRYRFEPHDPIDPVRWL